MKTLIAIFSFFALALAATTPAAGQANTVRIRKNAVVTTNFTLVTEVIAKCPLSATPDQVYVTVTQSAMQSNDGTGAAGTGTSNVKCDGNPQTIAVTVFPTAGSFNVGDATASATLKNGAVVEATDLLRAIENHPPAPGENPEE
jgi:hypothetical protein